MFILDRPVTIGENPLRIPPKMRSCIMKTACPVVHNGPNPAQVSLGKQSNAR